MSEIPDPTSPSERAAIAFARSTAGRLWPGSSVVSFVAMPADASARSYARLGLTKTGDAPETMMAMLLDGPDVAMSSEELSVFGDGGPGELPFINVGRYLAARGVAVPTLYGFSDDGRILLLEDVGDLTLWDAAEQHGDQHGGAEQTFGRALDVLADMQETVTDDGSGCYAFAQRFDERLFGWEFEHFLEYGVAADAPGVAECRAELAELAAWLGELPTVFCHRDYHAWNLHVDRSGAVRILDFQDALLAPALYDVASLLTDRWTPTRIDKAARDRLVARYYEKQRSGVLDGLSRTREAFARLALQRVLKVVGRFNYLVEVKGKPAYAQMLPQVAATARELIGDIDGLPATSALVAKSLRV